MTVKSPNIVSLIVILCAASCTAESDFDPPAWSEGVVWYQIFPERFMDGDPGNQPDARRARGPEDWQVSEWTSDWYDRAEWEQNMSDEFYATVFNRRYGGDLEGVTQKLDYLSDLGVEAIYFNPLFDAQSLHKYDASYYHHIDRNFGPDPEGDVRLYEREDPDDPSQWQWSAADSLFLQFIQKAHDRNIRVVIDGVWNHTGTEFWAFQDLVQKQEKSPYKDWYVVTSFDDPATAENEFDYEGWWGYKGLPVLREENGTLNKGAREHIFAVTRRWMDPNGDGDPSDGIDGWRLDVAQEVGIPFWEEWHELVRQINPEAVTIAEIWTDEAKEYIQGDLFTTVMNYRFTDATKLFLIDRAISLEEFLAQLQQIRADYPDGALHVLQNLMDSHDTARLASSVVNVGHPYNPDSRPIGGYEVRKPDQSERHVQIMVTSFQFTWPGAPMVYYGTESGMWGADDPDDRKPMVWPEFEYETEDSHPFGEQRPADENNFDQEMFSFYKKLTEIRGNYPVLKNGDVRVRYTDADTGFFIFERFAEGKNSVFVAVNPSDEPQAYKSENCSFETLLGGFVIDGKQLEINPKTTGIFTGNCEELTK